MQIGEDTSEPSEPEEPGEMWEVKLLDLQGKPVTGKGYEVTAPVEDEDSLGAEGTTTRYDEPIPGGHDDIEIVFDLKLLPKIDSLYSGYPITNTYPDADTGVPYDIGGEVEDHYDTEMDDLAAAGRPYDEGDYYNTCVMRTSIAFNTSAHDDNDYVKPRDPDGRGHGIPRGTLGSGELMRLAGDDKWPDGRPYAYAIRAREFEPFIKAQYPDAPVHTGANSGSFPGKDGVLIFRNQHVDILRGGRVRYNDISPRFSDTVVLIQHVIIEFKEKTEKDGLHTFVFEMKSR